MKCKKTFSLFELIAVIALVSILGSILLVNGLNMVRKIRADHDFSLLGAFIHEAQLLAELTHTEIEIEFSPDKKGFKVELKGLNCKNRKNVLIFKTLELISSETVSYCLYPHLKGGAKQQLMIKDLNHQTRILVLN